MDIPISDRAGARRSALREWALVVGLVAVTWLPTVFLGTALLLGILAFDGPLWVFLAPAAVTAAGIVRGFMQPRRLPGRAVRPRDEPELAALVRDVAERLGFREPLLVRIVPGVQASLGRATVHGVRSRVLVLGLPLLRGLSKAQLAAVIAHELAHEQHVRDLRSSCLLFAREMLADRLEGRFRLLAPLAAPLLRASQPLVWQAETAADVDSARVAGTAATAEALERTGVLFAAFDGLGGQWWAALAEDDACPEDFYDALDTALRDPHVVRRSTRAAAEVDDLDPYAADGHPPVARRVAALPTGVEAPAEYGAEPLLLRGAAAVQRWCVEQLSELDGEPGDAEGRPERSRKRRDQYDRPRPVRLLDLPAERLHELTDALVDEGDDPGGLRYTTRQKSTVRAVAAALDSVSDGSMPRLARRLDPGLRRVPAAARPVLSRGVLADAVSAALAAVLRESGWTRTGRWLSTVLTAPDGTVVDVHDVVADAVESGDMTAVRALLPSVSTQEAEV